MNAEIPSPSDRLEQTPDGPLVLLFYDGFDHMARRGAAGRLYSAAHRLARRVNCAIRRKHTHSGFYAAFLSLQKSLRGLGYNVRVNDFAAAEARPAYPVGVCGYPSVLEVFDGPNPILFGHGDVGGHAKAEIARQQRMRLMIQPCEWAAAFNRAVWGDRLRIWPVGIEAPPLERRAKDLDFVVYDKIRWHREERVPAIRDALLARLDAAGLTYQVLRYGGHVEADYRAALSRAKGLLFLCEHETQGIAYQEAMAAGIPVLAWDEGELVDPNLRRQAPDLAVTSVPYFDARCGRRFKLADFDVELAAFLEARDTYDPAAYMRENLSMRRAGEAYVALYASLLAPAEAVS
jgi:hypothetical protein